MVSKYRYVKMPSGCSGERQEYSAIIKPHERGQYTAIGRAGAWQGHGILRHHPRVSPQDARQGRFAPVVVQAEAKLCQVYRRRDEAIDNARTRLAAECQRKGLTLEY